MKMEPASFCVTLVTSYPDILCQAPEDSSLACIVAAMRGLCSFTNS